MNEIPGQTTTLTDENVQNESTNSQIFRWSSKKNLWMAFICWTIGLGNCWRFPVAASLDGGGAFLIPYLLGTFFIAIPFTFMEIGLGQFSNKSSIGVWAMCPLWKGVGYASTLMITCLMVYYNVVNGYFIFFTFASLSTVLPWSTCNPAWAKLNCFTFKDNASIWLDCIEQHGVGFCSNLTWESSAQHYWNIRVLNQQDTSVPGGLGPIRWELAFCSAITLFFSFLTNCKGTKSMEKVLFFFSVFPYVCLVILLFVSLCDPGSTQGVKYFLTPDFKRLKTFTAWRIALEQIVFSIGLGLSGWITLGSQCSFRNPAHMQAIALNLIDIVSSLCYGVMIFNFLGALSYDLNVPMEEVVKWPGALLFVKLPLSILYLPGVPQLWAFMFFSSMYIVGLRSQAVMLSTLLNTIYDCYPKTLRYTVTCTGLCCLVILLLGYPFVTQVGSLLVNYMDNIIVGTVLLTIGFLEATGVVCIYGVTRFTDDMHFMLGFRVSPYWQTFWSLSPFFMGSACFHTFYDYYTTIEEGPTWLWMRLMQWIVSHATIAVIFVGIVQEIVRNRKHFKCNKIMGTSPDWGPTDPILRKSREMFSAHSMTKEYMYRQNRLTRRTIGEDEDDPE